MKRILLLLIFIIVIVKISAIADIISEDFKKANKFYYEKQYDSALVYYKKIENTNIINPYLYYNLGNTYFKLNKIPDAIYYYEKAKKYLPRDKDIIFNLKKANLLLPDKIKPMEKTFFIKWIENIKNSLTLKEVFYLFSITFFLLLVIIIYNIYAFRTRFFIKIFLPILLGVFLIIEIIWLFERNDFYNNSKTAILYSENSLETINVKVAPREDDEDAFIVHPGLKIEILNIRNDWYEIKLENGFTGWVKSSYCRIL